MSWDSNSEEWQIKNVDSLYQTHIINPLNNTHMIYYNLMGEENAIYFRGKGTIVNNESVIIHLPDYASNIAADFSIQITPIYCGKKTNTLATSEIENNEFTVYGKSTQFYWFVYGVRI